jgi:HlyD family secretion protein
VDSRDEPKENEMRNKLRTVVIVAALLLVLGGGGLAAFLLTRPKAEPTQTAPALTDEKGQALTTVEAKAGSVSVTVEGPSIVEPVVTQTIRSQIEGVLVAVPRAGDKLEAGQVLVRFDTADSQKSVDQAGINLSQATVTLEKARTAIEKARADLASKKKLNEAGSVSRDQVTAAEDALANAEYALRSADLGVSQANLTLGSARADLASTAVRAPYAGVVLASALNVGDLVSKGAALLSYADLSRVRLWAEVDEYDIGKVAPGQAVSVVADALGGETLRSKVERVNPAAEVVNNISVFKVSLVLDNAEGRLKPGMSAEVSILIRSDKGVVVPSRAVSSVRGRSYVKTLENGELVTKRVTVGADDGQNAAVLEGLAEGERVVVSQTTSPVLGAAAPSTTGSSIIPITVPGTGGTR